MYAIIQAGCKQYKVAKGDVICVDLLENNPKDAIEFKEVLLLSDAEGKTKIGAPFVAGSLVKAECLGVEKADKIYSLKYKKRKNCRRKFGHRQHYSQVKILDIIG